MEPVSNCSEKGIYYYIGILNDFPKYKYHRKMFINTFEQLNADLQGFASTSSLSDDYSVLQIEYQNAVEGHCPFTKLESIRKIQRVMFFVITSHSKFNQLPLNEIMSFLKSGNIPRIYWDNFLKHPSIKNITASEYKSLRKDVKIEYQKSCEEAERNYKLMWEETGQECNPLCVENKKAKEPPVLQWFDCSPTSEKYLPSEPHEREHTQILRDMRQDAMHLSQDQRKKGALYLAINEGFPSSAKCHLESMLTVSLDDAVFYLYRAIRKNNVNIIRIIMDAAIEKSDYKEIESLFLSIKKYVNITPSKDYKKLLLQVFEEEDVEVLSILLLFESVFFKDNIAEQLLADVIDDCIEEGEYATIRSLYVFKQFDMTEMIKNAATSYLFKWIAKDRVNRAAKFLKKFPECFDLALEVAAKAGTHKDHQALIKGHSHLSIDTNALLKAACLEENFGNVQFFIHEYSLDVNPVFNTAVETGNHKLVDYLFDKGALPDETTLFSAVLSGNLEMVKSMLKYEVPVPQSNEDCVDLLKKTISAGNLEILNHLENYFEIDMRSLILRESYGNWTIEMLLEIIFKDCKNSISMMEYFCAVMKTDFLLNPDLIVSYIKKASPQYFHEKIYLISLTCADSDEQQNFRAIATMQYNLINLEIWGDLTRNPYLSNSDQTKLCEILKECDNNEIL